MSSLDKENLTILAIGYGKKNASAVLLTNGQPVAFAKEEWFGGIKEDASFPIEAINFCLQSQGLIINNIDIIAYPEKPYLNFYRSIVNHIKKYPFSLFTFIKEMKSWLAEGLLTDFNIRERLAYEGEVLFVPLHMAHAANAFFTSPFDESSYFILAKGEKDLASWGLGRNNQLDALKKLSLPQELNPAKTSDWFKEIIKKTRNENLCVSGELLSEISLPEGIFKKIHTPPSSDETGATLGAGLAVYHLILNRKKDRTIDQWALGPKFEKRECERFFNKHKLIFKEITTEEKTILLNKLKDDQKHFFVSQGPLVFGDNSKTQYQFKNGVELPFGELVTALPEQLILTFKNSEASHFLMDQYVVTKN